MTSTPQPVTLYGKSLCSLNLYAKFQNVNEAADRALARGQSFEDHWALYMNAEQRAQFTDRDEFVRLAQATYQDMTA